MAPDLHRAADALARLQWLDRVAEPVAALTGRLAPPGSTADAVLTGRWLGHPLHPLLTDIPIGSFTSATVLDVVGGRRGAWAADRLVELGLLSAVATAAAGAADWSRTTGGERRVGVVHATANATGVALYGASAVARHAGRRGTATVLGLAAMSVMTVGGYLGGFLAYARGVGVGDRR